MHVLQLLYGSHVVTTPHLQSDVVRHLRPQGRAVQPVPGQGAGGRCLLPPARQQQAHERSQPGQVTQGRGELLTWAV